MVMLMLTQRYRGRHRMLRSWWEVAAIAAVALQIHRLLGPHFLIRTFLISSSSSSCADVLHGRESNSSREADCASEELK